MSFAGVEEGGRGGLETSAHDFVDKALGEFGVTRREREGDHADAIFVAFEVTSAVEGLQGVRGVVLVGPKEGGEPEFLGVGALEQGFDEVEGVLVNNLLFVVVVAQQVVEFFLQVVEEHGVLVDVLEEELVGRLTILIKLDVAVVIPQV